MLFEPEQTWLHEVISERENRQTDIQCCIQLRQLRIFPMFARRAYLYKFEIF
jgi:hypothetical protein